MRALLVGDIHIDNRKTSITNNSSFAEIYGLFDLIKHTIYEKRPDYVIFFGDIFNSPYSITSQVMSIISELIAELSRETTLLFIVGNHDDIDDKVINVKIGDRYIPIRSSLLSPFTNYPNVVVFDSPKVIKITDTVEAAFIPYSTDIRPSLDIADKKFSHGSKRILIGHFDYRQFYDKGENVPSAEELVRKYKYDLVLLGHIHDPSTKIVDGKSLVYIGSSRNVDFRNLGEKKGIYYFDFDTFDMEYIDNPNTYIFKIFNNIKDLEIYCKENELEKLSKTKIMYHYSNHNEVTKVSKLKSYFNDLSFRKNTLTDGDSNIKKTDAMQEFEDLLNNDLITKEKLIDYALQFKSPPDKKNAIKILDYIRR